MYEFYFPKDGVAAPSGPTDGPTDTITANRYNVGGTDAFISGTADAKGMVLTAGGNNEALAIAADGTVTIKDLNVTGSIVIDGLVTDPDSGDGIGSAPIATNTTGPTINLSWGFEDIKVGNYHMANREPGEDSLFTFHGGIVPIIPSLLYPNRARLIIRGRPRDALFGGHAWMKVVAYTEQGTSTTLIDELRVNCSPSSQGYTTTVSPWFTFPKSLEQSGIMLQIHVLSLPDTRRSDQYRFGPIYLQVVA